MKNALLALLCSTTLVIPATFDIGWDVSLATDGVIGHWVYLGPTNAPVNIGMIGSTNKVRLTLPDGTYQIRVTATNLLAESLPSFPLYVVVAGTNVVAVTAKPGAPLNVQLR